MKNKKWTEKEDNVIRRLYDTNKKKVYEILKDRAIPSIHVRANKIKMSNISEKWTKEEDYILKKYYKDKKEILFKKLLKHRSRKAIYTRAFFLGLQSSNEWSKSEDSLVRKLYKINRKKLYKILKHRTISAIMHRASVLKMTTRKIKPRTKKKAGVTYKQGGKI